MPKKALITIILHYPFPDPQMMSKSNEYNHYLPLSPKRSQYLVGLPYIKSVTVDWTELSTGGPSTSLAFFESTRDPSLKFLVHPTAPEHRCYMI